jgi:alkylated DNA repair protein (DNA oxidative demethylase)
MIAVMPSQRSSERAGDAVKMSASMLPGLLEDAARDVALAPGAVLLGGLALPREAALLSALGSVVGRAPFRHMLTPGGRAMSVAMTSCGEWGWVTDRRGYRYVSEDPQTGGPWPALPASFRELAAVAAERAGYPGFDPDACLVNRYAPGARMSLHQDRDERDLSAPIVSISLGLPAVFLFGGDRRADRPQRVPLVHGDVVVWGGPARLRYHGVMPLADGSHPATGRCRINLTLRRAR